MTGPVVRHLRVMADYDCWPVWDLDQVVNIDPSTLPIPKELQVALARWQANFDAILVRADPASTRFESDAAKTAFAAEGRRLATELQAALGPGYVVQCR